MKVAGQKYGNPIGQFYYGMMVSLELDGNMEIRKKLEKREKRGEKREEMRIM